MKAWRPKAGIKTQNACRLSSSSVPSSKNPIMKTKTKIAQLTPTSNSLKEKYIFFFFFKLSISSWRLQYKPDLFFCKLLPASVEVARGNAPHRSILATHSCPGPTGTPQSSGPCLNHTPYTWLCCPWCTAYTSIPSERKVTALNHPDNPLPDPAYP